MQPSIYLFGMTFVLMTLFSTAAFANTQPTAEDIQLEKDRKYFKQLIPTSFKLFATTRGDLNKDGIEDVTLIVKATDPKAVVEEDGRHFDRNRRGIVVLMGTPKKHQYRTLLRNLSCFSSDQENGGVYFAPELAVDIVKGNLELYYGHGRYGHRNFKFRVQQNDLRLIGYDQSDNYGPTVMSMTSINFITGKKLVKENLNREQPDIPERFKETWSQVSVQPMYLSKIKDIEALTFQ